MAKQTITIRKHGDTVYFLNSKGFQKGTIKRTLVVSEKHTDLEIKYYVTCPNYADIYMGDEIKEELLFDSHEAMLKFYITPNKLEYGNTYTGTSH